MIALKRLHLMFGYLIHEGEVIDFAHSLLRDLVALLDRRLDALAAESEGADADALGVSDELEYVAGLGFVVCQQYLVSIAGKRIQDELAKGPQCGNQALAQVVNAVANCWKHQGEWSEPPDGKAERTVAILESIGVELHKGYPALQALRRLRGDFPKRLSSIAPALAAWRDDVLRRRGMT